MSMTKEACVAYDGGDGLWDKIRCVFSSGLLNNKIQDQAGHSPSSVPSGAEQSGAEGTLGNE